MLMWDALQVLGLYLTCEVVVPLLSREQDPTLLILIVAGVLELILGFTVKVGSFTQVEGSSHFVHRKMSQLLGLTVRLFSAQWRLSYW